MSAKFHQRPRTFGRTSFALILCLLAASLAFTNCRKRSDAFVVVLSDNMKTIDPIGSPSVDAASERVRALMFNSLIKKDDKFDYVPELASNIQRSDDGLVFTFTLREGVTFQDGRPFTSADAKYTLDTVLANTFAKSASFFEGAGANRKGLVQSVEAPDARTLVVRLKQQWTGLLPNRVPISIIPKDSYESQKTHPLGTGPFKFKSYDQSQQVVDLEANPNYWDGAPHISALRVRVISDSNAMQAELQSGRVDIAPLPTSLSPDAIKALGSNANLTVHQFVGSNLNLLTFNTKEAPLDNVKGFSPRLRRRSGKHDSGFAFRSGEDRAFHPAGIILGLRDGPDLSFRSVDSKEAFRRSRPSRSRRGWPANANQQADHFSHFRQQRVRAPIRQRHSKLFERRRPAGVD